MVLFILWRRAALLQVRRDDRVWQLLLRGLLASQALCWSGSGGCESFGWVICTPRQCILGDDDEDGHGDDDDQNDDDNDSIGSVSICMHRHFVFCIVWVLGEAWRWVSVLQGPR